MLASEPRVRGISVRVNGEPQAKATITWRTGQRDPPPADPQIVRVICVNKTDPPQPPDPKAKVLNNTTKEDAKVQVVNKEDAKVQVAGSKEDGKVVNNSGVDGKVQIVNGKENGLEGISRIAHQNKVNGQDGKVQVVSRNEFGHKVQVVNHQKEGGLDTKVQIVSKDYGQDTKVQAVNNNRQVQIVNHTQEENKQVVNHHSKEYDKDSLEYENGGVKVVQQYEKDKISVVLVKNEDERSSSGASSAPGTDCEDSDREGDDGTDSGFAPSRPPSARVRVTSSSSPSVKLTIASYSDKEPPSGGLQVERGDGWDTQFHMRELDSAATDQKEDSDDVQTKIATAHALLSGSGNGTFSLKNRVRSSIVSLLVQSASNRNYDQEEVGRIVFYTTSMGIVRTTFERCRKVRKILETLMVKFEERDVFMNRGFQQEVRERLGISKVILPQIFVEGRHLGNAEVIEQLNEIGHLRDLLRPYKKQSVGGVCQQCGGYRYLLCPICGGSKKSVTHRHHFSEDLVALRCVTCDESGLIRCQLCITGEV